VIALASSVSLSPWAGNWRRHGGFGSAVPVAVREGRLLFSHGSSLPFVVALEGFDDEKRDRHQHGFGKFDLGRLRHAG
jgi:hypothetical protein